MATVYSDQISEHQRDLTNSASSRFIPEILAALYISIIRLNKTMKSLNVDKENLRKNFDMNKGLIVAEPLYILLAAYNHPDAHEAVRQLTLKAQSEKKPLQVLIKREKSLQPYLKKFNKNSVLIIPLSTRVKERPYHFPHLHEGQEYSALLSQIRLISTKRLLRKIYEMDNGIFSIIRQAVKDML